MTSKSIRRSLVGGGVVAIVMLFGVGGWAGFASFSGAVIAPGALVVESHLKKVQHPNGGVVENVFVRDGDYVHTGDMLVRLDETITRASYAAITKTINELSARQARLLAERDDLDALQEPADIEPAAVEKIMEEERRLFRIRATARQGQKKQLAERITQLEEQARGTGEQIAAKKKEIELIAKELGGVRELWLKNLIPIQRLTALERDAARLVGEHGSLISAVAQVKGRIAETELQIIQIDQDMRAEVGRELTDIRTRLGELAEKKIAAEDQLKRIDIRAPYDGYVHQLAVHTIGGVVSASEPLMMIVPKSDDLRAEVRINPHDIDNVRVGQAAFIRFPAFNQRTTPELKAEVDFVSADVAVDAKTGQSFYLVRMFIPADEMARLQDLKLTPGMPIETYILTGDRTVISFLTKPLTDHVNRSFRER
ncbi:MAG: HlyD family type I secretion periplasmic adaptor subunit [Beijerinckiaceae bacterium]|nr:HlyD family type I secretion periplasmic adaptor subunit [Beijerinckiaceae bacterium]